MTKPALAICSKTTYYIPIFILTLSTATIFSAKDNAFAYTMSNSNYSVNGSLQTATVQDVKNTSGTKQSQSSQQSVNNRNEVDYSTFSGLGVPNDNEDYSAYLSPTLMDYGQLSQANPVSRTAQIKIISNQSGYQLYSYEDSMLTSAGNAIIPDSNCDNGLCNENTGATWTNNLTYGFGFRCDNVTGEICSNGFAMDNFMPFADITSKEDMVPIMTGNMPTTISQAQISYKVNISGTQQPGSYKNTVTYILVPTY